MSGAFSLSDSPGKNIRDGLTVTAIALALLVFMAGEWLNVFFICLWGIFVIIGLVMLVIGCVRAIRYGLKGVKTAPRADAPASKVDRARDFFAERRKKAGYTEKPLSERLILVWIFSCLLGPPLGWIFTSNVFFDLTEARAPVFLALRAGLTIPVQLITAAVMVLPYRAPVLEKFFFMLFTIFFTLPSVCSGLNSARDLAAGGVKTEVVTVTAFQPAGYFAAPWTDALVARNLNYGSFHARLADGRELDFYCTPVCLTFWQESSGKDRWAGAKPVKMQYLKYRGQIIGFEENLPE